MQGISSIAEQLVASPALRSSSFSSTPLQMLSVRLLIRALKRNWMHHMNIYLVNIMALSRVEDQEWPARLKSGAMVWEEI
jgi:hypothetical protein